MATDVTITVNPDGGADYTSMQAAVPANEGDISQSTGSDERHIYECSSSGSADTSGDNELEFNGYTVEPGNDNYIIWRPASGHQATRQWDATLYRFQLNSTGASWHRIYPLAGTRIDDLQIELTSATPEQLFVHLDDGGGRSENVFVRRCHLRDTGGNASSVTVDVQEGGAGGTWHLIDNIAYDFAGSFVNNWYQGTGSAVVAYNNALANFGSYGIESGESAANNVDRLVNNAIDGSGTSDLRLDNPDYTAENATSDATSPDGATFQNVSFTWEDAANDVYAPASDDTVLRDNGEDLSADATYAFTDDLEDRDRSALTNWGIGAVLFDGDVGGSTVTDTAVVTSSSASPDTAQGTGVAADTAVPTDASCAALTATDTGTAAGNGVVTSSSASPDVAQGTGVSDDTAVVTSSSASPDIAQDTGVSSDTPSLTTAGAAPLTAQSGNTVTDTAVVTAGQVEPVTADEAGVAAGADLAAAALDVTTGQGTGVTDAGADLTASSGQATPALDVGVAAGAQITAATATARTTGDTGSGLDPAGTTAGSLAALTGQDTIGNVVPADITAATLAALTADDSVMAVVTMRASLEVKPVGEASLGISAARATLALNAAHTGQLSIKPKE